MPEIKQQKSPEQGSKYLNFKHKYNVFVENIKKSENTKSALGLLGDCLLFGLLTSLALIPFHVPFHILFLLGYGCGLWLIFNKILPETIKLINAIKLVQVYK